MRTSLFSVLALASSFVSVLSAPAAAPVPEVVEKRQDFDALALVTDLASVLAPTITSISTHVRPTAVIIRLVMVLSQHRQLNQL